jgi:hypothetical protein
MLAGCQGTLTTEVEKTCTDQDKTDQDKTDQAKTDKDKTDKDKLEKTCTDKDKTCTDKDKTVPCRSFEGIEIYRTTRLIQTSETRLIIEKGVITASASAKRPKARCIPVQSRTYIVGADFHQPRILKYKPGLFEAYNFKATLSDGMLTSVGLDSAPDQGKTISNILTPIASLVSSMRAVSADQASTGLKACTDGPVVTSQVPG